MALSQASPQSGTADQREGPLPPVCTLTFAAVWPASGVCIKGVGFLLDGG